MPEKTDMGKLLVALVLPVQNTKELTDLPFHINNNLSQNRGTRVVLLKIKGFLLSA